MFATYTQQSHNALGDRTEYDFNALTDLLLRLHYDFDYVEEDFLASAEIVDGTIRIRDEAFELLILPPMKHLKLSTIEKLETFVQAGGRVLGMVFLPDQAFGPEGLVDVSGRIRELFGIDPQESQATYRSARDIDSHVEAHGNGKVAFLRSYAVARHLPAHLQDVAGTPGIPGSERFVIEPH